MADDLRVIYRGIELPDYLASYVTQAPEFDAFTKGVDAALGVYDADAPRSLVDEDGGNWYELEPDRWTFGGTLEYACHRFARYQNDPDTAFANKTEDEARRGEA